jgi:hypothetical protein
MKTELITQKPIEAEQIDVKKLRISQLEKMLKNQWAEEEAEKYNLSQYSEDRFFSVFITTSGENFWVPQQQIYVPGNSVVDLYNDSGIINAGGGNPDYDCRPPGGNGISPYGGGWPINGANAGCFLVGLYVPDSPGHPGSGYLKIYFPNKNFLPGWASIRASWKLGVNQGGLLVTAFNDANFVDNSGTFIQTFSCQQQSTWARKILAQRRARLKEE